MELLFFLNRNIFSFCSMLGHHIMIYPKLIVVHTIDCFRLVFIGRSLILIPWRIIGYTKRPIEWTFITWRHIEGLNRLGVTGFVSRFSLRRRRQWRMSTRSPKRFCLWFRRLWAGISTPRCFWDRLSRLRLDRSSPSWFIDWLNHLGWFSIFWFRVDWKWQKWRKKIINIDKRKSIKGQAQ